MIISAQHKFIFVAIPKTGTHSIRRALRPYMGAEDMEQVALFVTKRFPFPALAKLQHGHLSLAQVQPYLRPEEFNGFFKFAFVRNPWDRLLSCYLQKLGPGGRGLTRYDYGGTELHQGMSFAEFLEAVHEIPDDEADAHFRSQHAAVCDPDGAVMADFVGRFENLERDFALVAERLGLGNDGAALPHLTRSANDRRSYVGFYDDRLKKLVQERFEKDIETFGYSF